MVTTRSKTKSASMIGVMPGTLYVKIWAFMMVGYAAQMLLIPANMVTDHWDIASTPEMEFWIRGHAVTIFCEVFLMMNVETAVAAKAALAASVGIGILYPWNARFISKLDLKDFHRVPEVAFLALAGMAYLAK